MRETISYHDRDLRTGKKVILDFWNSSPEREIPIYNKLPRPVEIIEMEPSEDGMWREKR